MLWGHVEWKFIIFFFSSSSPQNKSIPSFSITYMCPYAGAWCKYFRIDNFIFPSFPMVFLDTKHRMRFKLYFTPSSKDNNFIQEILVFWGPVESLPIFSFHVFKTRGICCKVFQLLISWIQWRKFKTFNILVQYSIR